MILISLALFCYNGDFDLPWKEVRLSNGKTYHTFTDSEGNIHNKFPLSMFAGKQIPQTWVPAKNRKGEWCLAISSLGFNGEEVVQTWQPPYTVGKPDMTEEQFKEHTGFPRHSVNYGIAENKLAIESVEAQESRPGRTAQGNGPLTPEEYDQWLLNARVQKQSIKKNDLVIYDFIIASILLLFLFFALLRKKRK